MQYINKDGKLKTLFDYLPKVEVDHMRTVGAHANFESAIPEEVVADVEAGVADLSTDKSLDYRSGVLAGFYQAVSALDACQMSEVGNEHTYDLLLWMCGKIATAIPEDYDDGSTALPESDGLLH